MRLADKAGAIPANADVMNAIAIAKPSDARIEPYGVDPWQAVRHQCDQRGQAPPGHRESGRA